VKKTAFDAGVDDYITKPFSPDELVVRIRAQLARRSA
jgi:DNA-binding response OmpR family regulator